MTEHTEQKTQLTAGEAANLAHTSLSTQIGHILQMPDGPAKVAIASFETMLTANMTMIIEASNGMVDEQSALIDLLEARDQELDSQTRKSIALTEECAGYQRQLARMVEGRRADEDKVRKIEAASAQLVHQRDAHKRDADEGRRIKSELDKAKARIKRMEEAAIKREAEHNEDKMKLQRTESLLMRAARGVVQAKDAITHTQHQMILEGLQAEKIIEVAGIHYYLYRRPCVVSQTFKPTGDEVVSRDHMYIYRVETSAGYHWDAVPLQNGDIGTVKHKAIPKDVKKYLFEQYRESALFDVGQAVLKGPELTEGMDSLTTVLAELESIDHSLTPLKVKDSLKQTKARKLLRGKAA